MGENAQLLELGGVGDPEVEGSMKLVLYDDYFVQRVAPKWMSGRRPPQVPSWLGQERLFGV